MSAREVADRTRRQYWPHLVTAVDALKRRSPKEGLILGHHLGLNDADGAPAEGDTAGLASTLCLAGLSARAVGGTPEQEVACAVAVELAKDIVQVEDDILDEDDVRRDHASAWRAFGIRPTLLSLEATRAVACDVIAAARPHGLRAARHLTRYMDAVAFGQAVDLAAESRPLLGDGQVTPTEYEGVMKDKGAGMVVAAFTLGAVLVGAGDDVLDAMTRAGNDIGTAWQILDDITDVWGQDGPRQYSNDLRQGKKSYPVICALTCADAAFPDGDAMAERRALAKALAEHPASPGQIARAAELIEKCGGRRAAQARVAQLHAVGLRALEHPALERSAVADIIALTSILGTRGVETALTVGTPAGLPGDA